MREQPHGVLGAARDNASRGIDDVGVVAVELHWGSGEDWPLAFLEVPKTLTAPRRKRYTVQRNVVRQAAERPCPHEML